MLTKMKKLVAAASVSAGVLLAANPVSAQVDPAAIDSAVTVANDTVGTEVGDGSVQLLGIWGTTVPVIVIGFMIAGLGFLLLRRGLQRGVASL